MHRQWKLQDAGVLYLSDRGLEFACTDSQYDADMDPDAAVELANAILHKWAPVESKPEAPAQPADDPSFKIQIHAPLHDEATLQRARAQNLGGRWKP
jgi:hypothetical protein